MPANVLGWSLCFTSRQCISCNKLLKSDYFLYHKHSGLFFSFFCCAIVQMHGEAPQHRGKRNKSTTRALLLCQQHVAECARSQTPVWWGPVASHHTQSRPRLLQGNFSLAATWFYLNPLEVLFPFPSLLPGCDTCIAQVGSLFQGYHSMIP